MQEAFKLHCQTHFPELFSARLLIAVSGGVDSIVLAQLARELNWDAQWIHVNFMLRAEESEAETQWIKQLAAHYGIVLHKAYFDTKAYAQQAGLSTQLAARELRYLYFEQVAQQENIPYLLTAHHADDNLETFFINLSRASGIDGLVGIPTHNQRIRRPLLPFTRQAIIDLAIAKQWQWKEDSSNASTAYLRNFIRHQISPQLNAIDPQFATQLQTAQKHLKATQQMAQDAAVLVFKAAVKVEQQQWRIQLDELMRLPNYSDYLYHWLREFGFSAWEDINALVQAQSGKQIYTDSWVLLKNRSELILSPIKSIDNSEFILTIVNDFQKLPFQILTEFTQEITRDSNQKCIFVNCDSAPFPWKVRKPKAGDVFYPVGMLGKSKKLSKYFKDEKYSLRDKEQQWLLCDSEDQIIWVIGKRADERFTANSNNKNLIQLTLI